ncbi:MAG TPA: hypothetical protein VH186_35195 [Chloroflexia bacterium]|nr:hypothetical protein [Chloroflexia bacterium]
MSSMVSFGRNEGHLHATWNCVTVKTVMVDRAGVIKERRGILALMQCGVR